jgi:hypothetical protein
MKYTRFLQEWIDGTNLHTLPSQEPVDDKSTSTGIAGLLCEQCLDVFSRALPLAGRKFTSLAAEDASGETSVAALKELLGSLYLWGESFEHGKLDFILVQSEDLRESVLELLLTIAQTLLYSKYLVLRTAG